MLKYFVDSFFICIFQMLNKKINRHERVQFDNKEEVLTYIKKDEENTKKKEKL